MSRYYLDMDKVSKNLENFGISEYPDIKTDRATGNDFEKKRPGLIINRMLITDETDILQSHRKLPGFCLHIPWQ